MTDDRDFMSMSLRLGHDLGSLVASALGRAEGHDPRQIDQSCFPTPTPTPGPPNYAPLFVPALTCAWKYSTRIYTWEPHTCTEEEEEEERL